MAQQIHLAKGQSKSVIVFFLCPEHMLKWHDEAKCRSAKWNMQSDHRTIQLTMPEAENGKKKKRWTSPRKRELNDPGDFGEKVEKQHQGILARRPQQSGYAVPGHRQSYDEENAKE